MKIRKFRVENFGSYPVLEMDLENTGMALLYGPTGAGKSTVMDAICWCLYGVTAKGGNADDIRSWSTMQPTTGSVVVEAKGNEYVINRVRGKSSQNDLEIQGARGVNVTETQKLIDEKLGADAYTFIAASYFNEFSPTGAFFVAKAKDRRELFETLANLSLPNMLADKLSVRKSKIKKKVTDVSEAYVKAKAVVDQLSLTIKSLESSASNWEYNQALLVTNLETDSANWERERAKEAAFVKAKDAAFEGYKASRIKDLQAKLLECSAFIQPEAIYNDRLAVLREQIDKAQTESCSACGQSVSHNRKHLLEEMEELKNAKWRNGVHEERRNNLLAQIAEIESEVNNYADQAYLVMERINPYTMLIKTEKVKTNPYTDKSKSFKNDQTLAYGKLREQEDLLTALKTDLSRLEQLSDMCPTLRAELLKMAINAIQDETNNYLERYFDSELRIVFTLDGDNLDVGVHKSGIICSYKQLSKGQRQLLKLTFALSVMAASANQSGMKFENLFFDEALDGLDENLKLKAFSLFQALEPSYTSILLIDHAPAFQNMFAKKFVVGIEGDKSYIKEQHE